LEQAFPFVKAPFIFLSRKWRLEWQRLHDMPSLNKFSPFLLILQSLSFPFVMGTIQVDAEIFWAPIVSRNQIPEIWNRILYDDFLLVFKVDASVLEADG
jgi:hypothetical protein